MRAIAIFALLLIATAPFFAATWTGATSDYWNHASNWSPASVPTSSTDVVIPGTGITNWPRVAGISANCRNLTINSGGRVKIYDQPLTVSGNFVNNGLLDMQIASAWLKVEGDAWWNNGSTLITSGFCTFDYFGDLTLQSGSSMVMTAGFLRFMGSPLAYFINRSVNTQIWHCSNEKTHYFPDPNSGRLIVENDPASQPFTIAGNLQNGASAKTIISWTGDITLKGDLGTLADYDYGIYWSDLGTLIMDGYHQSIDLNDDSSVPNLVASQSGNLTLDSAIDIYGNLTIQSGTLVAGAHIISIHDGNWINTAGPDAFNETGSRVIFTGAFGHQYCNNSETFNILEVNKTTGALRVNNSAAVVSCAQYDWTNGAIDILAGTFTANDLVDDGVYGEFWVNPNATINLSNPGGSLDMKDVKVVFSNGGTININGEGGNSLWEEIDLSMSGIPSLFAFNGIGIQILGNPTFNPSFNLGAGTIRTTGDFQNDRGTFAPSAGNVELNGSSSSNLAMNAGALYTLIIDKADVANTVNLLADLSVYNWFSVDSGTLNLGDQTLVVHQASGIHGKLVMNNSLAVLDAWDNLNFHNGSSADIDAGVIYCGDVLNIYSTASFAMDEAAHLYMTNGSSGDLAVHGGNAVLGTLHIGTDTAPAVCTLSDVNFWGITIAGDLYVHPGSTLHLDGEMEVANLLQLDGVLNVGSGSLTGLGYLRLEASGTLDIDTGTCTIDQVSIMGGTLSINSGSFITEHYLYINSTASVQLVSGLLQCAGLRAEHPGTLQPAGGLIRLYDDALSGMGFFEVSSGNWVQNLELALPQAYTAIMEEDLTIKGNFNLISGTLATGSRHIYILGNWSNQGGSYSTGSGRVVFNGSGHQYVNYSETFNKVEANKSGGAIRVDNADAVVTIGEYDWTAGAVDVLSGTLTINDLADNGMYGGFYCTPGGTLNITQDPAQTLNLYGLIQLTGGTVNISGGSGTDANWARYSPSTVNMSGGTLNYLDKGIQIRSTFDLTCNITDGTITTTGDIFCNRTDFIPAGGTFEMRGATDTNLDFQSAPGSSLYNLKINKENLSARVSQATSVQTIRGYLRLENGTYYMQNRTLNCLGPLTVNSDAMLSCQGLSTVKMGEDKNININNGGYIDAVGANNDSRVTFTHYGDGTFGFYINNGGTLTANYILFEYMNVHGLNLLSGGIIAGLHNCTFQNGTPGGTLMRIGSTQDIFITNANFPSDPGSGAFNVRKSSPEGNVIFSDYSGSFSGAAHEHDDYDTIYWTGPSVNLRISNVSWERPDEYVCAPLTAEVTVQNNGSDDIVAPIRIDLYKNRSSAPPAGTLGDLYLELPALSAGTSRTVVFTNVSTDLPETWRSWARVDADQIIAETSETDNLWYYIPNTTWLALPGIAGLTITKTGAASLRLDWDYPIPVSRFNVYRSGDPYSTPIPGGFWEQVTTDYLDTNFTNDRWFYCVKAERDLP